jgi:hypothetical protein
VLLPQLIIQLLTSDRDDAAGARDAAHQTMYALEALFPLSTLREEEEEEKEGGYEGT